MRYPVVLHINDFDPYELCTQTYTQKYSHLNTENSKKNLLWRDNDFFTTFVWNAIVDKSGREFFGGPDFFCGREQFFLIEIIFLPSRLFYFTVENFFVVENIFHSREFFCSREFFSQSRIFL